MNESACEFVVTCEHGGNRVPARYGELFTGYEDLLCSHRGYDPGALAMARDFAAALEAPLFYSTTSRLVVELNRSPGHRQLFSEPVRRLPRAERERLMQRFYRPYRQRVAQRVACAARQARRVVHLSCHSFTPRLGAEERNADVGLLFDPRRPLEAAICAAWQEHLADCAPALRVRRNYPYRGTADSFVARLRRSFAAPWYAGIQLEVNQRFVSAERDAWQALRRALVRSFECALSPAMRLRSARRGGRPFHGAGRALQA